TRCFHSTRGARRTSGCRRRNTSARSWCASAERTDMRMPVETRYADYDSKGGDADFPFIVAEATVRYVSEAMIGQALDIEIVTSDVRTKAWVWSYVIRATGGDRVVAE